MKVRLGFVLSLLRGDPQADRAVPPTGHTAWLTQFTAGAMALLAVLALAFALATDRMAARWSDEFARTATLRISAPPGQTAGQTAEQTADQTAALTAAALRLLDTTPGVLSARALTAEEQRALLAPWFGPDLPLDSLPIPQLIEIVADDPGYDATGLRARLEGEVPGALLDDHTRWRDPLLSVATRLRLMGFGALLLIGLSTAAMITLAARAALFANAQVIAVLRLVGARDVYIARAFVRRFTLRALAGAVIGTAIGLAAIALLPSGDVAEGYLTGLAFSGRQWALPLLIPLAAALTAFLATRAAALRALRGQS